MVRINIYEDETLTETERGMIFSLLELMCSNEAFYKDHMPVTNETLSVARRMLDANGNTVMQESVPVTYKSFVAAIHKGLKMSVRITVQTENGEERMSVPFFPVTLIDVPICKRAMVTLDYRPEFDAHLKPNGVQIGVSGELLNFVSQDVDEKAKEDNGN